jgi:glucose-6-phosphate 1-dehydrogenase
VFYLATGPSLFVPICRGLASVGLNENARIVLEKPLGYDLRSSNAINDAVGEMFAEEQIYRIDHYLGKEPVQNLLALRFGNALFEPLWRREWVESIQITIAEELGVEARGDFYDNTGALRDMVQNHLLQLLSIVAMEPPHSMDSDSVRDEKLRVLRALKPIDPRDISKVAVRGQYHAGVVRGTAVPAYATEPGVKPESTTETFVALKVEIDNWRWAGVPFFLRTGKRLADRIAEIVVNFRPVPHSALGPTALRPGANRLVIRLQPNETIRLYCLAKQPGEGMNLSSVHLDLAFDQFFREGQMEAYQRLLLDVINGRLALFVRRDEQEAAWKWVEPILNEWAAANKPKPYAAGTWGPAASSAMLAQHGTCWLEEEN